MTLRCLYHADSWNDGSAVPEPGPGWRQKKSWCGVSAGNGYPFEGGRVACTEMYPISKRKGIPS